MEKQREVEPDVWVEAKAQIQVMILRLEKFHKDHQCPIDPHFWEDLEVRLFKLADLFKERRAKPRANK